MKLPYYYKLTIRTWHSPDELAALLRQHTLTEQGTSEKDQVVLARARRPAAAKEPGALFSTTFTATGFALFSTVPEWDYKPMGRAVCVARWQPEGSGSRVWLTCKAVLFIRIFMFIWGSGAAFGILAIFFGSLAEGKYQDALITPFAMLPFPFAFWLFHKLLFQNDVDKALRFLRSIGFVNAPDS
jgi:hypothetical protein